MESSYQLVESFHSFKIEKKTMLFLCQYFNYFTKIGIIFIVISILS